MCMLIKRDSVTDRRIRSGSSFISERFSLAWVIVTILLVILGAGLLVPVYGDEAAAIFMRGQFIANGWRFNSLLPQCGPGYLHSLPALLIPGALVYDVLYSAATPLGIRIIGVSTALLWVGMSVATISALIQSNATRRLTLASFAAIMGLGVLPLTLVMMRSEQILLVLLTLFLGLPLFVRRYLRAYQGGWLLACAFAFCIAASIFFYTHPKALFFFPLVIVSGLLSFGPRSRFLAAGVGIFVLLCVWQGLQFASALTACTDAPILSALLASNTISFSGLKSAPGVFLAGLIENIQVAPVGILQHLTFADRYQSAWLAPAPDVQAWWMTSWINDGIYYAILIVFWAAVLVPPVLVLFRLVRRLFGGAFWCLLTLWVGFIGHVALYRTWNFYAGALVIPLAGLLLVRCLAVVQDGRATRWPVRWGPIPTILLAPLFLLFLGSSTVLLFVALPPTARAVQAADLGLPEQALSIPTFGYAAQKTRIRAFADRCHLQGDGARRLVVDNLTFFAFDRLREPLQSDYLYDQGFGVDLKGNALPALLKRLGSKGVIAQCTLFSESLKGRVLREGNLCCVDLSEAP